MGVLATKAVLWAHSHHVWLDAQLSRAGSHLRARIGLGYRAEYVALGRGEYNASSQSPGERGNWRPHPCPPPPPGAPERLLDQLDLDRYAVAPADLFDILVYFREAHPCRLLAPPEAG